MIAALRSEQSAMLNRLREHHLLDAAAKRKRKLTWGLARCETTQPKGPSTAAPRRNRRLRHIRRDKPLG
jgi:hypothetical protein